MDLATAFTRALAVFHVVHYGIHSLYETPSPPTAVPTISIPLARMIRPVPSNMCPPLLPIQLVRPIVTTTTINDIAAALGTFDPFEHSLRRSSNVSTIHDFVSSFEADEALNIPGSEKDTWTLAFWRPADTHNIKQAGLILSALAIFGILVASLVTILRLKNERNALQTVNDSLEESLAQKSATIVRLDVKNFVLEDANSQMEVLLAVHSGDKAVLQLDLQKGLQDTAHFKEQASIQIADLQQQLNIVEADLAEERNTTENLTLAAVEMEMEHLSTIHDVRSQVATLESTLETVKTAALAEVDKLAKKLHSTMDSRDRALEIQRDQIGELITKEAEISSLRRQHSELRTAERACRREVGTLKALLENTNRSNAASAASASRVRESLQSEIDNLKATSTYYQNTTDSLGKSAEMYRKMTIAAKAAEQESTELLDAFVQTFSDRVVAQAASIPDPATRLCACGGYSAPESSCGPKSTAEEELVATNPVSPTDTPTLLSPVSLLSELETSGLASDPNEDETFEIPTTEDLLLVMDQDAPPNLLEQSFEWESKPTAIAGLLLSLPKAPIEAVAVSKRKVPSKSLPRPKPAAAVKRGSLLPTPTPFGARQLLPRPPLRNLNMGSNQLPTILQSP